MAAPADAFGVSSDAGQPRRDLRLLYWGVGAGWLTCLAWVVLADFDAVRSKALVLGAWVLLLAAVNLLPLTGWESVHLTADLPITIAAAIVLSPGETALVATVGAFETREFNRRTSASKALFDRSQIGLASFLASVAVHAVVSNPSSSPFILILALLALLVDSVVNYSLVAAAVSLERNHSFKDVVRSLRLGTLPDFLLTLAAWVVLGAMLVALYTQIAAWALLGFVAPALLGRQVLLRSQMYTETHKAYLSRESALVELANRVDQERTDERRLIAADLHDDVLQPLFKVTLMTHVLKADLAKGRLLQLEEDLPELAEATELASSSVRNLIGDLRRSSLGAGGLTRTLEKLVKRLSEESTVAVHASIDEVRTDSGRQLALYQIAKEGLSNAIHHSKAANVWIELRQDDDGIRLSIRDDGVGFDPDLEKEGHFGILIMRERAAAYQGSLFLDTALGQGCLLTCVLPKT